MSTNKVQHGEPPAAPVIPPPEYSPPRPAPSMTEEYMRLANEFHTGQMAPIEPMPRPSPIAGVPMGLEYLAQLAEITVNQKTSMQEKLSRQVLPSRYTILNSHGQLIYLATEESDGLQRQCCGSNRGFVIHINDNSGQEVMRVRRDFKCIRSIPCVECCCCCSIGCCSCVRMEVEIEAPVGQVCGYVVQRCTCGDARFSVLDAQHQDVLTIDGPRGCCSGCNNFALQDGQYKITTSDGAQKVGTLTKHNMGTTLASITTKDKFVATFPMDLDVRMKAVLLGAVFFIDYMYFEYTR